LIRLIRAGPRTSYLMAALAESGSAAVAAGESARKRAEV